MNISFKFCYYNAYKPYKEESRHYEETIELTWPVCLHFMVINRSLHRDFDVNYLFYLKILSSIFFFFNTALYSLFNSHSQTTMILLVCQNTDYMIFTQIHRRETHESNAMSVLLLSYGYHLKLETFLKERNEGRYSRAILFCTTFKTFYLHVWINKCHTVVLVIDVCEKYVYIRLWQLLCLSDTVFAIS